MNLNDQFINFLHPLLLALSAVMGLVIVNALVNPTGHQERSGTVEIYSLSPDLSTAPAP